MTPINKQKNMQNDIEVLITPGLTPYEQALNFMSHKVEQIISGQSAECLWLLEHPPTYTAGRSTGDSDIINIGSTPLFHVERGGRVTYHGPGQLVGYLMLDLRTRKKDVRLLVASIEQLIIDTLKTVGIKGERRRDRIGIWVTPAPHEPNAPEKKIAAIGLKLKKWVSYHGFALNIDPDLAAFTRIVPCGIQDYGVTSMAALGYKVALKDVQKIVIDHLPTLLSQLSS